MFTMFPLPKFPTIAQVMHPITGEWLTLDEPVQVHRDDAEWAARQIQDLLARDWEIARTVPS